MALSGDHVQQVFLDSTYRNRKKFPHPTEFESTVKPEQSINPSDPVGIGYALFKDIVASYDNTTTPNRIQLTSGIAGYENRLLGRQVEITTPAYALKGTSHVVGFTTGSPIMYIYLSTPINNVMLNDIIFIRQLQSSPLLRVNPTAPVALGATSFQVAGGSNKADAYKGMFFRNVSTMGSDHRIISYDISTFPSPTITFAPAINEPAGFLVTDFIEIYDISDNEGGMNEMGSVANRGSPTNHEIRLEWLRIPRHPLYVANDVDVPPSSPLTVNNFSYLLVEFRNKSFGSSRIIQSNNRYIKNCQFIVPIEDLSTGLGKFYTVRSPCTIITPYNPNDIIKFSVKLPNGQSIQFDPDDEQHDSLSLPNPDMQITAMFSVRRLLI